MDSLFQPLTFAHGPTMKNRFMLAPLTNTQSHEDGTLSDDEFHWLVMRAQGGFGLTMTCAAHVQALGKGFSGQLGIFSEIHEEGLTRLASAIKGNESLAIVQLHHAGMRSPAALIGSQPLCPSKDEKTGAREMTRAEVQELVEDFIAAAQRAERCGFDGVELHGAHGYILGQFLSGKINQRSDDYGGSLENRSRILFEIIDGIRDRCGPNFNLGLRLSPERFGQKLAECQQVAQECMASGKIDFLDMSLWDFEKEPEEEEWKGRSLRSYFLDLDRGKTRMGVAGMIRSAADARRLLEEGFDYVTLGRAAILHHDFPKRVSSEPGFQATSLPVTSDYLRGEGLSDKFLTYMGNWPDFISDAS